MPGVPIPPIPPIPPIIGGGGGGLPAAVPSALMLPGRPLPTGGGVGGANGPPEHTASAGDIAHCGSAGLVGIPNGPPSQDARYGSTKQFPSSDRGAASA